MTVPEIVHSLTMGWAGGTDWANQSGFLAFAYGDASTEERARVLGIPPRRDLELAT